ncbi:hypothetical protein C4Y57_028205 [Klebsiella variicola]|uniref:ATP-dependent metallopeptidase FtsH/Yme1/Tma family protein n=1 Tax=Klebsiella variicola TaxID=244366 RepID=UPI000CEBD87C|nr:hypothetical protein C4Y57_028205 [Klebsiella variicola]SWL29008.1 FtsH Extracellular [Klebsiella pneumoniae]HBW1046097.1 hypothetical protein [Klebsiella pneumoniae]HBW3215172.1 hypothetical protein [Klebsiella pneumoniae]HBW7294247.1 hypothetical protein [Klebsiella pneumoniae]
MEKKNQWNTGYWIVALLLLLSLQSYWQTAKTVEPVPYSEFEKALDEGRVAEVLVSDRTVTGRLKSPDSRGKTTIVATRVEPDLADLTHAHLVVLTFAHAQQALRIAQAIAERRPALTLWVSCRSTTAADAFRAMPNVRVYQQSFAAAIGLAEQVMSTLGMSTELIEGHISAMRRRLDSSRFPGSLSS